jgi:SAM-dependent methyltransferase
MSVVFDRAVAFYDRTRGLPLQAETWMAEVVGVQVPAGSPVLEIGIGTGRIALPLVRHNQYRYIGIDLSRNMMAALRDKAPESLVTLVQGDMTRLPFAAGTFDAVVAVHVFHLVSAWQQAMDEAARVLREGGVLLHGRTRHTREAGADELRHYLHQSASGQQQNQERGLLWHDQVGVELERRFGAPRELTTPSWTVARTPREILELYGNRCWSSTWAIPDETLARVVAEGERWAIERFGSLDAPLEEELQFVWDVYRPAKR